MSQPNELTGVNGTEIAIIGMAGRFPGARHIHELWENLQHGIESISFLSNEELDAAGVDSKQRSDPCFVRSPGGVLEDKHLFDASFFGYTPKDAEIMDPQMRILHECAFETLESAGYDPESGNGVIGFYAGASSSSYWEGLTAFSGKSDEFGVFAARTFSDRDFLTTRISYKLNLKGPSFLVQTACSTSLVAVHLACQGILNGECNMALAGGVSIPPIESSGYLYQEGMIMSPDGHCRAFDREGKGTAVGSGVGMVLLKLLEDAWGHQDYIYAVIKGTAINNDGREKIGYTAPGIEGQAEVIRICQRMAEVEPESIGYIETHGTGTTLGDPAEIEALKMAFDIDKKGFCAIGSLKTNIGHLDAAAGVAGLIKTALVLKHRLIPPSLNFNIPNPRIDFINSPFYVNTRLTEWKKNSNPLRAGVSSFGIGGTNAHVILEEAPARIKGIASEYQLILLSARTPSALEKMTGNLVDYLKENPSINLADAAYTLQVGRQPFQYRRMLLCSNIHEAISRLTSSHPIKVKTFQVKDETVTPVILLFPGLDSRYVNTGVQIYQKEPFFQQEVQRCLEILKPLTDHDIKHILNPPDSCGEATSLFIFEYALARLVIKWGIEPYRVMGRGRGKYAAACIKGTIPLEKALNLVIKKEKLNEKEFKEVIAPPLHLENPIFVEIGPGGDLHSWFDYQTELSLNYPPVNLVNSNPQNEPALEYLINKMGELWLQGKSIKWSEFYPGEMRYRIPLPTYPFERQSYRIEAVPMKIDAGKFSPAPQYGKSTDMADWFYLPSWKRSPLNGRKTVKRPGPFNWMVFIGNHSLGSRLVKYLEQAGHHVIIVKMTVSGFKKIKDREYQVNPCNRDDFDILLKEIEKSHRLPDKMVHLWGITGSRRTGTTHENISNETIENNQDSGFYSLLYLTQSIAKQQVKGELQLAVVTDNMQDVTGEERVYPGKATVLGPVKVIPQEHPYIFCRSIDLTFVDSTPRQEKKWLEQLVEEFTGKSRETVIAYRGNYRWVQTFEPEPLQEPETQTLPLREKGVYLVTGGLGDIGFVLAEFLAKHISACLVLTGRSFFPSRERWESWLQDHGVEDPISLKIKMVQYLEQLGGKVMVFSVDTADYSRMQQMVGRVERQLGPIRGVIHSAGIVNEHADELIENIGKSRCLRQFPEKIYAPLVLKKIFKNKTLDFCWLMSSISSVLGGLGFAAYAAANIFMDTFLKQHNRSSLPGWISVNWDEMEPGEAVSTFKRILSLENVNQVVISTGGQLQARIDRWIKFKPLREANRAGKETASHHQPRPRLSSPYVAPSSPGEKAVTEIWQHIFGFDRVGIQDNFFELGGDSLKAIIALSRIHKELKVVIPITEFFQRPTAAELALYINKTEETTYSVIKNAEKKEYYELSSAQKRLFILQEIDKECTAYNQFQVRLLEGEPDIERLQEAFNTFINRHETLRTSIKIVHEKPVQLVHENVNFVIQYHETREEKEADIIKNFKKPFDLGKVPLLKVGLIKTRKTRYLLLIEMHHIITDAISYAIFLDEIIKLYACEELPVLALQYKDYAQWQQSGIQREAIKRNKEYWVREFEGEIPILNLPTDYVPPMIQSFVGSTFHWEIGKRQTRMLKEYALKHGTTLYMILLAIYNIFIAKISGQEDIVVGSPVAGRPHKDLENIIGMFVNTLALRNFPHWEKSFNDFLAEVKDRTLKAFAHQDYPYEELVEMVAVTRDASRNPLFDTMFVLQNVDIPRVDVPALNLTPYPYQQDTAIFSLTLQCTEMDVLLQCSFEYCTKLFKKNTIERFIIYFQKILATVLENPNQKISQIEIITAEEKQQLLYGFNDTAASYPKDKTLHQLFAEQVEQTPDNTALVGVNPKSQIPNPKHGVPFGQINAFGEASPRAKSQELISVTYKELNEKSHQLALLLINKGVRPDTIVAIITQRSLEMIIGIFGILKAGGAYMPIDPGYPQERIDFMLKDSHVGVLLTTAKLQVKVKAEVEDNFDQPRTLPLQFINIETGLESSLEPSPSTLTSTCRVSPANLAYIIYTSGSTGKPKGVMVEYRSVVNILSALFKIYPLKESDCYLLKTSLTFDVSVSELLGWIRGGGRLVIPGKDDHKDPGKIIEIIEHSHITHINFVPSMFGVFIDQLNHQNIGKLTSLKYIFLAGEALPPQQVKKFKELNTGIVLENLYGPTEGTIYVSRYSLNQWSGSGNIPIGKPLQNVKLYILNNNLWLVPLGVTGELYIAGVGLSRGYLNKPELTAEKFDHDFWDYLDYQDEKKNYKIQNTKYKQIPKRHHSRIYRTGDLARWLPDGNIEFLGRLDDQVKIRGFRIEPGEIENQLLTYDGIKETVVLTKADEKEDKFLCAYFVSDIDITTEELRNFLSGQLPDYMIPTYFVSLESIPLTPNGKVDRKALPEPGMEVGPSYIGPGNKIEKKLVEIWSELLSLDKEKISIDAHFFQLGGHSLKAAVMTTKVQKELHVKLPMAEIFKNPNIKSLSRYIKEQKKKEYIAVEPIEKKEYYFLSPAQKRLYIQQQMDLSGTAYNMPQFIFITSEIQGETLREILKHMIKRHESFRTSFHMKDEEPVQKVHDEVAFEVETNTSQSSVIRHLSSDFIRPFDLSQAPLMRVGLLKRGQGNYLLMIDMHHIISDGISHEILESEFMQMYKGQGLPVLRLQYKDFSQWRNHQANTLYMKNRESYWLKQFTGIIPTLNLPTDYPRGEVKDFKGSIINFEISAEAAAQLRKIMADEGTTSFITVFAVFYVFLAQLSGQEDIIVGTPVAGRNHADLEPIIGMFVNTLTIRNYPRQDKTFLQFLREVKTRVLEAFENQDYPLEELVEKVVKKREPGRSPLFDVMFQLRTLDLENDGEPGHGIPAVRPVASEDESGELININRTSKYDLIFDGVEIGKKLSFSVEYSTRLFKRETIVGYVDYFQQIINEVLKKSDIPLKEIKRSHEFQGRPLDNPEINFDF